VFTKLSNTKKVLLAVVIVAVLGLAYYAISPLFRNIEVQDEVPVLIEEGQNVEGLTSDVSIDMEESSILQEPVDSASESNVSGPFPVEGTFGHSASGSVRVFKTEMETIIRYEDFETINGPNLHVYISKDLEGKEFIDLGPIKGTRGNINYTIPEGIDITEYNYILTWCVPFRVLFNYAPIN